MQVATSSGLPTASAVTLKPLPSSVTSAMTSEMGTSYGSWRMSAPNCVAISRRILTGSETTSVSMPWDFKNAAVKRPMIPAPTTRPVARYGMSSISTPDRQQAAGSVKAAVSRSRDSGISTAERDAGWLTHTR